MRPLSGLAPADAAASGEGSAGPWRCPGHGGPAPPGRDQRPTTRYASFVRFALIVALGSIYSIAVLVAFSYLYLRFVLGPLHPWLTLEERRQAARAVRRLTAWMGALANRGQPYGRFARPLGEPAQA